MAHRTSAAALHAARVLLRHYDFTVKPEWREKNPDMQSDERCLAIVIDYGSNVFQVAQLRPELRYWQEHLLQGSATARQIGSFFARVVEIFGLLPRSVEGTDPTVALEVPRGLSLRYAPTHTISRPAWEAARFLFNYYRVQPKQLSPGIEYDRGQVAKLVDVSTNVFRAVRIFPAIERTHRELELGHLTALEIGLFLKRLGIELEHLPNFEDREEEVKLLAA